MHEVWLIRAPSKRIPDAMHSKTLRNDSPTPICLSDVLIVFSTRSSRGLEGKRAKERNDLLFNGNNCERCAIPHPSWKRKPGGNTVTQVSKDPDDDDGRIQVADFSLETKRKELFSQMTFTSHLALCSRKGPQNKAKKAQEYIKKLPTNKQIHINSHVKKMKTPYGSLCRTFHLAIWRVEIDTERF